MGLSDTWGLKIRRSKLNDELTNQAAHFAHAAEEAELLHAEMTELDIKMEFMSDDFTEKTRAKYRNVNPKLKPTETALKAMLGVNPEMKALKEQYRQISNAYRMAKIRVDALKMRADMMGHLANNVRQEKKQSEGKPKV